MYARLPDQLQKRAVKQYRPWLARPSHPSLEFKKVGRYWSARVSESHRTLGVMTGDTVVWFWIGTHDEYERLLKS